MLQLHATAGCVLAEEVLERTEHHQRPRPVGMLELIVYRGFRVTSNELPAVEIDVCHQVFFPSLSNGWLEGQHQDACPLHSLCQLIGGEGLSEAHLAVPEKVRCAAPFLGIALEVGFRFIYRPLLLLPHSEGLVAMPGNILAFPYGNYCRPYLLRRATIPFALYVFAAHLHQSAMHVVVEERSAVLPHRALLYQYPVGRLAWADNVVLLAHTFLHSNRRIAHLQNTLQVRVVLVLVSINPNRSLEKPSCKFSNDRH